MPSSSANPAANPKTNTIMMNAPTNVGMRTCHHSQLVTSQALKAIKISVIKSSMVDIDFAYFTLSFLSQSHFDHPQSLQVLHPPSNTRLPPH